MMKAEFNSEATSESTIRKKILESVVAQMGAPDVAVGPARTIGEVAADVALQTNLDAQVGGDAPGQVALDSVSPTETAARVKLQADAMNFGDAHDAAYHAHKHAREMTPPPLPEHEFEVYLLAARATIKKGTAEPSHPAQRSASQSVTFVEGGNRCIVSVDATGQASIATFMPGN